MHINFSNPSIKQGKVEEATIYLDESTAQKLLASKIAGQSLESTIYLMEVGPLTKTENNFEASAKVIFLKIPESKALLYKGSHGEFPVTWSPVEIVPTEATQELIFETFSIPAKKDLVLWFGLLLIAALLIFIILKFRKAQLIKTQIKKRRASLRDDLLKGSNYVEVVEIWKKREEYLNEFPAIHDHFKKFEQVLYKYQFKPSQSEAEKIEVMQAYREFVNNVSGGLNGV